MYSLYLIAPHFILVVWYAKTRKKPSHVGNIRSGICYMVFVIVTISFTFIQQTSWHYINEGRHIQLCLDLYKNRQRHKVHHSNTCIWTMDKTIHLAGNRTDEMITLRIHPSISQVEAQYTPCSINIVLYM